MQRIVSLRVKFITTRPRILSGLRACSALTKMGNGNGAKFSDMSRTYSNLKRSTAFSRLKEMRGGLRRLSGSNLLLQKGFTFIEVMVAVAIFGVISSICFAALSQYLKVREGIERSNREIQQLQRAFSLMERDLRFLVNRPVRDEYGDL